MADVAGMPQTVAARPLGRAEPTKAEIDDYQTHVEVYRGFVRGVVIFVAHVAVILLGLAYFLT